MQRGKTVGGIASGPQSVSAIVQITQGKSQPDARGSQKCGRRSDSQGMSQDLPKSGYLQVLNFCSS